ncbi:MAG: hypothetical protein A2527_07070 [Candidatus Lambdaproteobacteria bacterium RIFOXYD2_FULL_50_16]|uniref:ABC-2 type transporter domain-containing protein n=1 Tax=Candidatus Lambdaproteobacteria bacterium RIFOXYD2_FULL_50_16 TaxID=1817772 RepID=A0A1F6GBH9_9PROT|nr:MAG: hypothetical protein A2527_07070 [Candidatus Lambdaproteobacteria bacterium RIFOXYD2_FULL_50_16]
MEGLKPLWQLIKGDGLRSRRDSRLGLLLLTPWLNALMARMLLPRLSFWLKDDFDLVAHYPLILGFLFLWLAPLSLGLWAAELLLEERQSGLCALLALPLPKRAYLAYRLWVPALLSYLTILGCLLIAPHEPLDLAPILWMALAASLQTPLLCLLLFSFSANREGAMALARLLQILGGLPILAYFLTPPYGNLIGLVFPPYWLAKAFWSAWAEELAYWQNLGIGLFMILPLLGWAKSLFLKSLISDLGKDRANPPQNP